MPRKSGLNHKQQRFVQEYLKDSNATQAAIRAGYSANNADVTGPRLLGHVGIRAAVEKKLDKAEMGVEWVLNGLKYHAEEHRDDCPPVSLKAYELVGRHRGMFHDVIAGAGGLSIHLHLGVSE